MNQLFNQDCHEALKTLENNSIDSLITDPPAGISFMNKSWDSDKGGRDQWIEWMCGIMKECHRVMKPGAHGLIWSIPRTSHWTGLALEKAGFEVRDVISHLFGQGFPKSLNISKAIDKAAGTEAAKQWDGWGTALKPAVEMWWLVRKPCSEKTVASNVLKWGTGGINIDGCRIEAADQNILDAAVKRMIGNKITMGNFKAGGSKEVKPNSAQGRFPANLVFSHNPECEETCSDECAVKMLNEQAQNAPRFFYCAKVSPKERNVGLDGFKLKRRSDARPNSVHLSGTFPDHDGRERSANHHPTVKPQKLMRYLCKLITPPGGVILDPFMGSGSTGMAAVLEKFRFVGMESDQEYYNIAKKRIEFSINEYLTKFDALHKNNGGK